jgi:hypothetical protein
MKFNYKQFLNSLLPVALGLFLTHLNTSDEKEAVKGEIPPETKKGETLNVPTSLDRNPS